MQITADEIATIVVELRKYKSEYICNCDKHRLLQVLNFLKENEVKYTFLTHFDIDNIDRTIQNIRIDITKQSRNNCSAMTPDDFLNQFYQ